MDTTMNINQEKLNASLRYLNKEGEMNVECLREAAPEASQRLDRLGELLKDEDFCRQFVTSQSREAAAKLFADRGFDITDEELTALAARVKEMVNKLVENGGELSEDELKQIAGGADITWREIGEVTIGGGAIAAVIGSFITPGVGTLVGAAVGAVVGLAGIGGRALANWLYSLS